MRFGASMSVDMILKRSQGLEAALADAAFVRSLLGVRLHVTRQQVPFRTGVVAVVAHVRLRHHLRFSVKYFDDF